VWDQDLLDTLWANSAIYIHGHRTGGTNPALLRGAAAGTEVVHHDNPFNNEVTGALAWRWKTESALVELLQTSPWLDSPKGAQLAKATLSRYNWNNIVGQYEALFARLVELKNG
jgi:hypothetical protein